MSSPHVGPGGDSESVRRLVPNPAFFLTPYIIDRQSLLCLAVGGVVFFDHPKILFHQGRDASAVAFCVPF